MQADPGFFLGTVAHMTFVRVQELHASVPGPPTQWMLTTQPKEVVRALQLVGEIGNQRE